MAALLLPARLSSTYILPCQSFTGIGSQRNLLLSSSEHSGSTYARPYHVVSFGMAQLQKRGLQAAVDPGRVVPSSDDTASDLPPPGCTRIKVELNKPLGMVLEEDKAGNIFVAELVKDGNADKSGLINVGDQLIATSAIVYDTEEYYQGVKVRKGMQIVRLSVYGEKFETVMAAIGTHPAHVKVALEIQKCQRSTATKDGNNGAVTT